MATATGKNLCLHDKVTPTCDAMVMVMVMVTAMGIVMGASVS